MTGILPKPNTVYIEGLLMSTIDAAMSAERSKILPTETRDNHTIQKAPPSTTPPMGFPPQSFLKRKPPNKPLGIAPMHSS